MRTNLVEPASASCLILSSAASYNVAQPPLARFELASAVLPRAFFVTCASKPLSGTGHSKTMRAKARRNPNCTRGVKRRHSDLGPGAKTCSVLQCAAGARPGTRGPARTWGSRVASRHWQLVERQEASPSTARFNGENHQGCISSRKE